MNLVGFGPIGINQDHAVVAFSTEQAERLLRDYGSSPLLCVSLPRSELCLDVASAVRFFSNELLEPGEAEARAVAKALARVLSICEDQVRGDEVEEFVLNTVKTAVANTLMGM